MIKLAANLSYLFTEMPFLDRFQAAARMGFEAVELLAPHDQAGPADIADVARAANMQVVLTSSGSGDWQAGDRGLAAHPGRSAEFMDTVSQALECARSLSCTKLHVLAGSSLRAPVSEALYRENLAWACCLAAKDGIEILIEPINQTAIPGYALRSTAHAAEIVRDLRLDNLKILYDFYHAQLIEGRITASLTENFANITHIQIAGVPDRGEPVIGELNLDYLLAFLDRLDYQGYVGCEYKPTTETATSLDWAAAYGVGRNAGRPRRSQAADP